MPMSILIHLLQKRYGQDLIQYDVSVIKKMDADLSSLATICTIDLVPGGKDPTNLMLPQAPIPNWILPSASTFKTVVSSGNPHYAQINGQRVLFLSGEFLDGSKQFGVNTAHLSPVEFMEKLLRNRHISPSCPDTIRKFDIHQV